MGTTREVKEKRSKRNKKRKNQRGIHLGGPMGKRNLVKKEFKREGGKKGERSVSKRSCHWGTYCTRVDGKKGIPGKVLE